MIIRAAIWFAVGMVAALALTNCAHTLDQERARDLGCVALYYLRVAPCKRRAFEERWKAAQKDRI